MPSWYRNFVSNDFKKTDGVARFAILCLSSRKGPSAQGANLTNEVDLVSVATFAKGWRRRRSKKGPNFADVLFEFDNSK